MTRDEWPRPSLWEGAVLRSLYEGLWVGQVGWSVSLFSEIKPRSLIGLEFTSGLGRPHSLQSSCLLFPVQESRITPGQKIFSVTAL